ncbi:MAG: CDP-alcohol phosphatidyltransferase family protein [Nocardioides sp.]|jgi:phosphatidylglycerophosphate synthase
MIEPLRAFFTAVFTPIARLLLALRVSPDMVTLTGTAGVVVLSLWLVPQGRFVAAIAGIWAFAICDLIDGTMARMSEHTTPFGAFLDSTLDRIADAAIFSGVILWYAGEGDDRLGMVLAMYCLVTGSVISYARSRAESLGYSAKVGLAERADRLVLLLFAGLFSVWFDEPRILVGGLAILAALSTITVLQRVFHVRRQATAASAS